MAIAWIASFLVAAIPTAIYVALIRWCDRYEKEPGGLLAAAFLWGAAPAILLALGGESLLDPSSGGALTDLTTDLISASLVAPVVEEIAKGLALVLIFWFFRDEFDGVLDGIIYGALVGFGFGMTEDMFYLASQFMEEGWEGFGMLAFFRIVVFGLNHAFFTGFVGAGLGYARITRSKFARVIVPILGLLAGIVFHALHNLGATLTDASILAIGISLVSNAGGVLIIVLILVLSLRQEKRWLTEELRPEIGVLISADEYNTAISPRLRLKARAQAARKHGLKRGRQVRQFYYMLSELAIRLRRYRNGRASKKDLKAIPKLREKIALLRPQIAV